MVENLAVNIDMPDRYESGHGIQAASGGMTIDFNNPFRATPMIQITAHDLDSGDYYRLTDIGPAGFSLCFYDAAGLGVTRHFDYVAKGYGRALM